MGQKYVVTDKTIALTASTAKTLIEVITTANAAFQLVEWSIEFDQFNAAQPVVVTWAAYSAAVTTATATTPVATQAGQMPGSNLTTLGLNVNRNTTVEGAGTASSTYELHTIPITSGLFVQYPYGREISLPISTASFRLVATPGTTGCNATYHAVIEV